MISHYQFRKYEIPVHISAADIETIKNNLLSTHASKNAYLWYDVHLFSLAQPFATYLEEK